MTKLILFLFSLLFFQSLFSQAIFDEIAFGIYIGKREASFEYSLIDNYKSIEVRDYNGEKIYRKEKNKIILNNIGINFSDYSDYLFSSYSAGFGFGKNRKKTYKMYDDLTNYESYYSINEKINSFRIKVSYYYVLDELFDFEQLTVNVGGGCGVRVTWISSQLLPLNFTPNNLDGHYTEVPWLNRIYRPNHDYTEKWTESFDSFDVNIGIVIQYEILEHLILFGEFNHYRPIFTNSFNNDLTLIKENAVNIGLLFSFSLY